MSGAGCSIDKIVPAPLRKLLCLATCMLSFTVVAQTANSPAVTLLLQRARAQSGSGHLDIAVATWKQVLAIDPDNREALQGLATAAQQAGRKEEANQYIARLRKGGASAADIAKVESTVAQPGGESLLQKAKSLTQAGKYADAMAIYRKLYGDNPPNGEMALIYYDTMAALPADRPRAIAGLRRLAQQFDGDERYAITLGRVLTYDAPTRAEGISILQKYPNSASGQAALHQAQAWTERSQAAAAASAAAAPVAASPAAAAPASPIALGYRALNAGSLGSAESYFQQSLAHENAKRDAYAGLGYVRMRQQDFPGAMLAFEQARQNGNEDPKVAAALQTARFWIKMADAGQAAGKAQLEEAIAGYRAAVALKPGDIDALNGLGGTLLRAGRASDAMPYLLQATRGAGSDQQHTTAWRLLFVAQSQAGQTAEAIRTAERIPVKQRGSLEQDPEFLATLASDYTKAGNRAQADKLLGRAFTLFRNNNGELNLSQRQQYAALLANAGRYPAAVQLYRQVLAEEPGNTDAWRGVISAQHQAGQDAEALASLRSMGPEVMATLGHDAGFLALMASIEQSQGQYGAARRALDNALKLAPSNSLRVQKAGLEMAAGDPDAAAVTYREIVQADPGNISAMQGWISALHTAGNDRAALKEVSQVPEEMRASLEQNPDFVQLLASIYGGLGDRRRALLALGRLNSLYASQGTSMPPSALLQQGWLLLQTGDNARLAQVIRALATNDSLTDEQQTQLANLWANWAVQRSASLVRAGNPTGAQMVLAAALRAFPDNPEVNNTLAGGYMQAGNARLAVALYARQDMSKADEPVFVSAINAALAANDRTLSEQWLTAALARFGRDAKILELAARFEEQRGDRRKAAAYYRAALQAFKPPTVDDLLGESAAAPAMEAEAKPAARAQLFEMLAPDSAPPLRVPSSMPSAGNQEDLWPSSPAGASMMAKRSNTDDDYLMPPPAPSYRAGSRAADLPVSVAAMPATETTLMPLSAPSPAESTSGKRRSRKSNFEDDLPPIPESAAAKMPANPPMDPAPMLRENTPSAVMQTATGDEGAVALAQAASAEAMLPLPNNSSFQLQPQTQPQIRALQPLGAAELTATLDPPPALQPVALPTLTAAEHLVQPPATPAQQVQQKLETIENSVSSSLAGDSYANFHSGQPGFDKLTIFGADVVQSAGIAMGARLSVITQPMLLDNQAAQADATYQIGSLPLGSLPAAQTAAGVGGEIQLRARSFGAALGYTPYGFLVPNITGRLLIQPNAGPVTLIFERQPVTDSQLSYAGLRDPGSIGPNYPGNIWGGVIADSGALRVSRGTADSGWYGTLGGQELTGRHVRQNFRIDGDAGAYWSFWQRPEYGKLTLGMNFFGMHYANNQRQFTYGNGGYFSPGAYLLSSIPLTFDGVYGPRLHYHVNASLGLQAFQEDSAPYFPLDPGLQSSTLGGYLPDRSGVGANYDLEAETSYLINSHWYVNGFFSVNNTRDYNNDRVGFSLRYAFRPQPIGIENGTGTTGIGGLHGLIPLELP